jgi:opacity protein-like surface antigen
MRKLLFIACSIFLLPAFAMAQEAPSAELFGGYSYFRTDGGANLHGWNASVAGNINRWFGLVADFSGHYNSESSSLQVNRPGFPVFSSRFRADRNIHKFMVGPRFSYRGKERITPFAHALFGVARIHTESETVINETDRFSFSGTNTAFAMAIGAGLDVKLSDSIALRVIQADYVLTRLGGFNEHNGRGSVGIVFRFGNR